MHFKMKINYDYLSEECVGTDALLLYDLFNIIHTQNSRFVKMFGHVIDYSNISFFI